MSIIIVELGFQLHTGNLTLYQEVTSRQFHCPYFLGRSEITLEATIHMNVSLEGNRWLYVTTDLPGEEASDEELDEEFLDHPRG